MSALNGYCTSVDIAEIHEFRNIQKHETPTTLATARPQLNIYFKPFIPSAKSAVWHQGTPMPPTPQTLNYELYPFLTWNKTCPWVTAEQLYHLLLWKMQHGDASHDDSCALHYSNKYQRTYSGQAISWRAADSGYVSVSGCVVFFYLGYHDSAFTIKSNRFVTPVSYPLEMNGNVNCISGCPNLIIFFLAERLILNLKHADNEKVIF